ncbi:hypothetical protein HYC85_013449 [Camellia sinensis]|uniref:THIF-type NAD/FAD binding fold domain-containing protein n=1 Tax=Camellia sinensis TaxID=4442 RepID=A0A7J7H3D5_CAMSI|nr:hypothetical protein HYC85_013449 [Camellia sinensis]
MRNNSGSLESYSMNRTIWEEIHSGKAEEDSAVLSRLNRYQQRVMSGVAQVQRQAWGVRNSVIKGPPRHAPMPKSYPGLRPGDFDKVHLGPSPVQAQGVPHFDEAYASPCALNLEPRVAMSNLLRQSLYTLDDCLNGGEFKATAAVKSLEKIFPAVEAEGVVMAIPMPGHPVPSHEENIVLEDCKHLHDLIDCDDAVFLLTDTRESRWLPALLCANANKITVTAALGFDSFLVICHGAGPLRSTHDFKGNAVNTSSSEIRNFSEIDRDREHRLGCYFCNDVVAPIDVVSEYWERGMDFVLQAINHPTFLEDLTGRTELMKSASSFELDWDDEMDDNDNNDNDCVEI